MTSQSVTSSAVVSVYSVEAYGMMMASVANRRGVDRKCDGKRNE